MSTLSELYITMENLHKLNLPIDERLKQEAAKLEADLIRSEILRKHPKKYTLYALGFDCSFALAITINP